MSRSRYPLPSDTGSDTSENAELGQKTRPPLGVGLDLGLDLELGLGLAEGALIRPLLVGPLPPPMTGTHVTFAIFCRELAKHRAGGACEVIDTSQKRLKRHTRIASFANLLQASRILREFRRKARRADRILIFGSNGFLSSMAPILVWLSRRWRKPVFVRAFGGSLDQHLEEANPVARRLLQWMLRRADGVSVQTALLADRLRGKIGNHVQQTPGFRYLPDEQSLPPVNDKYRTDDGPLRLVFVSLVREEKGIFVLLDCFRQLLRDRVPAHCDIYGPVWPADESRFHAALALAENVTYRGVLEPDKVIDVMRSYHALVFPTFYPGEGHPGVLIEAVMAGIPAITTRFRSIPEVISDGVDGVLVEPRSSAGLASAIANLANDRASLGDLARPNADKRFLFDARTVIPRLARQMGIAVDMQ